MSIEEEYYEIMDLIEEGKDTTLTIELFEKFKEHILKDNIECFEDPDVLKEAHSGSLYGEAGKGFYGQQASIEVYVKDDKFFVIGSVMTSNYKEEVKTVGELRDAVYNIQESIWDDCMSQ
jgi:hypothetical protein